MSILSSMRPVRNTQGFSLVEMMVALTISLLVMAGVGMIFVNTKRTFDAQERLARVQENGRFAMHYLMRDLRAAGYAGCLSNLDRLNSTVAGPTDFLYNLKVPVEGINDYSDGSSAWLPSGNTTDIPAPVKAGTDIVAIRMVDPSSSVGVTTPMPNSSAELNVSDPTKFKQWDVILLSDCATADMMQITEVQPSSGKVQHRPGEGSPGNTTQKLQKPYDSNAKVFRFTTRRYFIRANPNGVPSLYMDDNGGVAQELVEGIEDLQITYGIDATGDRLPDRYLKGGQTGLQTAADWANVVSVRFGLLSRSLNKDAEPDIATYNINGEARGPFGDGIQRRVFLATILMRNVARP